MVEYQEETYDSVIDEIKPLLEGHYQEIANNRDVIKLNPDYEIYKRFCELGQIRIVTARADGELVGYCIVVVRPHLH